MSRVVVSSPNMAIISVPDTEEFDAREPVPAGRPSKCDSKDAQDG
jgi:hypothetical protein